MSAMFFQVFSLFQGTFRLSAFPR